MQVLWKMSVPRPESNLLRLTGGGSQEPVFIKVSGCWSTTRWRKHSPAQPPGRPGPSPTFITHPHSLCHRGSACWILPNLQSPRPILTPTGGFSTFLQPEVCSPFSQHSSHLILPLCHLLVIPSSQPPSPHLLAPSQTRDIPMFNCSPCPLHLFADNSSYVIGLF